MMKILSNGLRLFLGGMILSATLGAGHETQGAEVVSIYAPRRVRKTPLPNFPYKMIAPPNPKADFAISGILASRNNPTVAQAKELAVLSHKMVDKVKVFPTTMIFVFNNLYAAQNFAVFQNRRRGAPLSAEAFQKIAPEMKKVVVCYFSDRGVVRYFEPAKDPANWWKPLLAPQKPSPQPPAPKTQNAHPRH